MMVIGAVCVPVVSEYTAKAINCYRLTSLTLSANKTYCKPTKAKKARFLQKESVACWPVHE